MKLCVKCGREMKRTLLMNTVSEEYFQKYNCNFCGIEMWQKINSKGSENNIDEAECHVCECEEAEE